MSALANRLQLLGPQRVPLWKSSCQSLLTSETALAEEACHSPVVFFVHQVVPGPEGHQVSIGGRLDGHGACAAHVGVVQLVGEDLQLIGREAIVIPKHVVVRGPACSLKAGQEGERQTREGSRTHPPGCAEKPCFPPERHRGRSVTRKFLLLTMYHQMTADW